MRSIFKVIFFFIILMLNTSCLENKDLNLVETTHMHEVAATKVFYTCGMHPQVKKSKAGKCPICHMNLTKIELDLSTDTAVHEEKNTDAETWQCRDYPEVTSQTRELCPLDGTKMIQVINKDKSAEHIIAKVKLRKSQMNHFFPEYFPVTRMKMSKRIRLLGSVLQSEERESSIPARIGGRVEKVYVKSTGSMVKLGDPVVDLYSPKLITSGEEYLLARKSFKKYQTKDFKDMIEQSTSRLKLWGIKKFQYESWYKNSHVPRFITIYSNTTGIVRKRNATKGKYFVEGENFFELSDLSDVWVEMDVYEHDSSLVKLAQKVELEFTAIPGETLVGEIDFVSPVLDIKSRTLKVRATIKNSLGKLKPGMIANAVLNVEVDGEPLVVPRSAIIDTGKRKVVWVKKSMKTFQARVVESGYESEGYVEIKSGLKLGDEVVIEGSFLLDAQAQLFGGYETLPSQNSKDTHR